MTRFIPFGRGIRSQVLFTIKEQYSSSIILSQYGWLEAYMKISLNHDSLKNEPKKKMLTGTVNVLCVYFLNHQKDHRFLLMLCRPIKEAVVLVQLE